jgi:hypothetical protein
MKHRPLVDLPMHAWRALHSGFTDWLLLAPREITDAMVVRIGGHMNFERWMLAVHFYRRLDVYVRVDEGDNVRVGISVPVVDGDDWLLFDMDGREVGVEPEWLITAGKLRLDEELTQIMEGDVDA